MAGLAGYVKKGILTDKGIEKACSCLGEFKHILDSLSITDCSVFATASLRNISNTEEAVEKRVVADRAVQGFGTKGVDPVHRRDSLSMDFGKKTRPRVWAGA